MTTRVSSSVIRQRVVHLDLKGTPPIFSRLLELLELFAALRFTAVLVEWEDAFPWSVDPSFRSVTAYTEEEVGLFVEAAKRLGLELIPLTQSLGHMENFLKGDDRAALREVSAENDALNPLARGAGELVQAMLRDVLRLMPDVKRYHLGGDEAWSFGTHPETSAYIAEYGAAALYLHHIEPLLSILNERDIRPMLWHDMMVKWDDASLVRLAPQCDLVVWGYGGHPDEVENHYNSRYTARFSELGFTLWGASAFKGADAHSGDRPNPLQRRINAQAWLEVAQRYGFAGMIATGWSRYSFNGPQCESIESSLDTLLEQAMLMDSGVAGEAVINDAGSILAEIWSPVQAEQFVRIRMAATDYTNTLLNLWEYIRIVEVQLTASCFDARKQPIRRNALQISRELEQLALNTQAFQSTLEPVIPKYWLDEYFSERNDAVIRLLKPYIGLGGIETTSVR